MTTMRTLESGVSGGAIWRAERRRRLRWGGSMGREAAVFSLPRAAGSGPHPKPLGFPGGFPSQNSTCSVGAGRGGVPTGTTLP